MSHMNRVIIMGNLAADPELRQVAGGKSMTRMRVAVNRQWRGADGTPQKRVDFFGVVTWNSVAENCARFLAKGRPVLVEGALLNRSWDGPDGKKRWSTDIQAHAVHFLNARENRGTTENGPQAERLTAQPDTSASSSDGAQELWEEHSPLADPAPCEPLAPSDMSTPAQATRRRSPRTGAVSRGQPRTASDEVPF